MVLRDYYWLFAQGNVQVVLREPYEMLGIKLRLTLFKANTLQDTLFLAILKREMKV